MTLILYSYAGPGASYTGEVIVADPYGPAPESVTTVAPPSFTAPQIPAWRSGAWVILDAVPVVPPPPPPPPPPYIPNRITKVDFLRLFSFAESAAYEEVERQARALAGADFADPTKQYLVGLRISLRRYDAATEFIELNHPDTVAFVWLLQQLGVLTNERAQAVIAGRAP